MSSRELHRERADVFKFDDPASGGEDALAASQLNYLDHQDLMNARGGEFAERLRFRPQSL